MNESDNECNCIKCESCRKGHSKKCTQTILTMTTRTRDLHSTADNCQNFDWTQLYINVVNCMLVVTNRVHQYK